MARDERRKDRPVVVRDGDATVSVLPRRPGPTDTPFDVVAAAVAAFAPPGPVALLGFAAGGVLAPLRALGCDAPVVGVDRDLAHERTFRRVAGAWAGDVRCVRADAAAWARRAPRGSFAAVIDDLSVPADGTIVKPRFSFETLPRLVAPLLFGGGLFVDNLLPHPEVPWSGLVQAVLAGRSRGLLVDADDWENRVLVAGRRVPDAREAGRRLRAALDTLGSEIAGTLRVRRVVRS